MIVQRNFIGAWHSIAKLQHSVVQKKLQLDKEKLEMKLSFILHSHVSTISHHPNSRDCTLQVQTA